MAVSHFRSQVSVWLRTAGITVGLTLLQSLPLNNWLEHSSLLAGRLVSLLAAVGIVIYFTRHVMFRHAKRDYMTRRAWYEQDNNRDVLVDWRLVAKLLPTVLLAATLSSALAWKVDIEWTHIAESAWPMWLRWILPILSLLIVTAHAITVDPEPVPTLWPFADAPGARGISEFIAYSVAIFGVLAWISGNPVRALELLGINLVSVLLLSVVMWQTATRLIKYRNRSVAHGLYHAIPPVIFLIVCAIEARWFLDTVGRSNDKHPVIAALGLGWLLAAVPSLVVLPFLSLAFYDSNSTDRHLPRVTRRRFELYRDLVRSHLVTNTILQQNLPFFLVSFPWSLILALQAMPWQLIVGGEESWTPSWSSMSLWIGATLAWVGPYIQGLYTLEVTLSRAFGLGFYRGIKRLRGHVLILGYGDLGRRILREQFHTNSITYETMYEHLALSHNVLMPDGALAKLLLTLAAVDDSPQFASGAMDTPEGVRVNQIDVTRLIHWQTDEQLQHGVGRDDVRHVCALVVGDASAEQVQRIAGFEKAGLVISAIRRSQSADRSQSIVHRLEQLHERGRRVPPLVVTAQSSTFASLTSTRKLLLPLPIHHVFTEHMEGLRIGNELFAAFLARWSATSDGETPPRILVCGRGKRNFYIVDAFFKNLTHNDWGTLSALQHQAPFFVIMGADSVLDGQSVDAPELWKCNAFAKTLKTWNVKPFVERRLRGTGLPLDLHDRAFPMALSPLDSRDFLSMSLALADFRPNVIVVSDHDPSNELRTLQAISTAVDATQCQISESSSQPTRADFEKPLLLVVAETGRRYLNGSFQQFLTYYDTGASGRVPEFGFPSAAMFPDGRQFKGESLVDVLEETAARVLGIQRAYQERTTSYIAREDSYTIPAEISFCASDAPGTMVAQLARLGGLRARATGTNQISLNNSTFHIGKKGHFTISSLARLGSSQFPSKRPDAESLKTDGCVRVAYTPIPIVAQDEQDGGSIVGYPHKVPSLREVIGSGLSFISRAEHAQTIRSTCCGMPVCPVAAVHRAVLVADVHGGGGPKHQVTLALKRIQNDHYATTGFQGPPEDWNRSEKGIGLAQVEVLCEGGYGCGTAAIGLGAFLQMEFETLTGSEAPSRLFNLTAISGHECHDQRFGYVWCFGRFEAAHSDRGGGGHLHPQRDQVVRTIRIRPVGRKELGEWSGWQEYAASLAKFLNRGLARDVYELAPTNRAIVVKRMNVWPDTPQGPPVPSASTVKLT